VLVSSNFSHFFFSFYSVSILEFHDGPWTETCSVRRQIELSDRLYVF
jgi:hypothetical protein